MSHRVFSLTWPVSMQIYWNKRKRLHEKRVRLTKDWFGTPTWLPFHCLGTPIWLLWAHLKTLHNAVFTWRKPTRRCSIVFLHLFVGMRFCFRGEEEPYMLGQHNWTVPIMISWLCLEQTKIKVELKTDLISTMYIHKINFLIWQIK